MNRTVAGRAKPRATPAAPADGDCGRQPANLGPDIRESLTSLRNATEIFRVMAADDPRLKAAVAMIERQIARLARLADDLDSDGR